jgi:hypothetical protein
VKWNGKKRYGCEQIDLKQFWHDQAPTSTDSVRSTRASALGWRLDHSRGCSVLGCEMGEGVVEGVERPVG